MYPLSPSLLSAQQSGCASPNIKLTVRNRLGGASKLRWEEIYAGTQAEGYHSIAIAEDGAMIRIRLGDNPDNYKLYFQRVAQPGPGADFGQWTYSGSYFFSRADVASFGSKVYVVAIDYYRNIFIFESTNNGQTWLAPVKIGTSNNSQVYGLSIAFKPSGDMVVFYIEFNTLCYKKRVNGNWQSRQQWDKSTGALSGVSAVYDGDWRLVVSGNDTSGCSKVWSLSLGDGADFGVGIWSSLYEFASAPAGGLYSYSAVSMDCPDVFRVCYLENYTGNVADKRAFLSHLVVDNSFSDNIWCESVPTSMNSEFGFAMEHDGQYVYLAGVNRIYRAKIAQNSLEIGADILKLESICGSLKGSLAAELDNSSGRYNSAGSGELDMLSPGSEIEFAPGYETVNGAEHGPGQLYIIQSLERRISEGKSSLLIWAEDSFCRLKRWRATNQMRWNRSSSQLSVRGIMGYVLSKAGIRMDVLSASAQLDNFYPDFTIHVGDDGFGLLGKLLSFVPDLVFLQGHCVYSLYPQEADSPVYSYGFNHPVYSGIYADTFTEVNRVVLEGMDSSSHLFMVQGFLWDEIYQNHDLTLRLYDRNINTLAQAEERLDSCFRKAVLKQQMGQIVVPMNCGQQLFDVVNINQLESGLETFVRRINGIRMVYEPGKGIYRQELSLGRV
ncbi:hypothetical protein ABFB50_04110 [Dehalococcoides sp. THU3]|uniref:hypothetical protein n=1 Tax=Dehalococcoides TaxID=61434 RepID=UPI0005B57AAE|nr:MULTISPECIES: hypothetical protein [Dehalococcoides]QYY58386.1 hypothetical protein CWV2_000279 [Dehalococcoides mccartyi]BAQ34251.1 hypothetical protein UCH007_02930 [Dehalococcoides sp. UCH007]